MKLLGLSNEEIIQELERLDKEAKSIKDNVIRMSWYMRGGMTVGELMEATASDREQINQLIKENLETTKKSGMPFF